MKVLYHGTRYLNAILADQCLGRPRWDDMHVYLSTRKYVAKYFAELPRDDVFGFGYIFSVDRGLLEQDGFDLKQYSGSDKVDEHEIACSTSITRIWRYIVKIEKVSGSYSGPE